MTLERARQWLASKGISEDQAEDEATSLKAKWGGPGWRYQDPWATFQKWVKRPPLQAMGPPTRAGPNGVPQDRRQRRRDAEGWRDLGSMAATEEDIAAFERFAQQGRARDGPDA